jgi:hypothetical protein
VLSISQWWRTRGTKRSCSPSKEESPSPNDTKTHPSASSGSPPSPGLWMDITNMDTPTIVAYNSNVKLFFSIIIFNTCVEWMLHHNMCSMSFIEVLTLIKECVDHAWKGWIMKHMDWGPNPSAAYTSIRSPHYLWYKETSRPSLILFGKVISDFRNSPHQNYHRDHIWMER